MKPIEHYKILWLEAKMKKYVGRPASTFGKPNTFQTSSPEKRQLKLICEFIRLSKGIAAITDSAAVRIDNRKIVDNGIYKKQIGSVEYRKNPNFKAGHSDITATWKGQSLFIELKRIYKKGKDRQSQVQKEFQQGVTESGGTYIIVHSFDHFYEWANENGLI